MRLDLFYNYLRISKQQYMRIQLIEKKTFELTKVYLR